MNHFSKLHRERYAAKSDSTVHAGLLLQSITSDSLSRNTEPTSKLLKNFILSFASFPQNKKLYQVLDIFEDTCQIVGITVAPYK